MEPLVIILDGVLKVIRRGVLTSTNSVAALRQISLYFKYRCRSRQALV
jgi:hypothetical protein